MEAGEIDLEAMIERRHELPEWAVVRELSNGTGHDARGRIDLAAFNCWPSKKFVRIAYEVKRTRGDFLRELKQPTKREWVEKGFHETWFVVLPGVCTPEELPEKWGLLVASKNGKKLMSKKPAVHRDAEPWDTLCASALRAMCNRVHTAVDRRMRFEGEDISTEDLRKLVNSRVEAQREALDRQVSLLSEERARVAKERKLLKAPMMTLVEAMAGNWDDRSLLEYMGSEGEERLTADHVRSWIQRAQQYQLSSLREKMVETRDSLEFLISESGKTSVDPA
jgi:hypothetical protein